MSNRQAKAGSSVSKRKGLVEVSIVAGIVDTGFVVLVVADDGVDLLDLQLARPSYRNALKKAWRAV